MLREAVSRASAVRCRTLFGVGECVSLHETNARPAPSPCDAARQEIFIKGKTKKRKKAYTSVTSKRVVRSSVWPGRKGGMPSSHTNPETAETQRRASCTAHRAHTRARPSSAAHLWPRSRGPRSLQERRTLRCSHTHTHRLQRVRAGGKIRRRPCSGGHTCLDICLTPHRCAAEHARSHPGKGSSAQ